MRALLRPFVVFTRAWLVVMPMGDLACEPTRPAAPYTLAIDVRDANDQPLAGAVVEVLGKAVGKTGEQGVVELAARGVEGERIAVTVTCPAGYASPSAATEVTLHRLSEANKRPEYDVRCAPLRRDVIVAVRADHGPDLPVLWLGREVGRTDESGAAHLLLDVEANAQVELTLSTQAPGHELLRPQNPTFKFSASDHDPIHLFAVAFQREHPPVVAAPHRALPVRLN